MVFAKYIIYMPNQYSRTRKCCVVTTYLYVSVYCYKDCRLPIWRCCHQPHKCAGEGGWSSTVEVPRKYRPAEAGRGLRLIAPLRPFTPTAKNARTQHTLETAASAGATILTSCRHAPLHPCFKTPPEALRLGYYDPVSCLYSLVIACMPRFG